MWPAEMMTLPIALLFLAAWIGGGSAMLWAGGRFLAGLPKATFRRSLIVRLLHAAAAWGLLGLARWPYVHLGPPGAHPGLPEALAITGVTLLGFWLIIDWTFEATLGRAMLAWLPMAGEAFILFVMVLLLPELPFWG